MEKTIGIIVENKFINGLEINLECVIITFNHRFSVFNVCCSPKIQICESVKITTETRAGVYKTLSPNSLPLTVNSHYDKFKMPKFSKGHNSGKIR